MAKKKTDRPIEEGPVAPDTDIKRERARARDAVRHSQRIASQLHQLIAASLTVATLRDEAEILSAIAISTRNVFDATTAVVTLESGVATPLRGVSRRDAAPRVEAFDPGAGEAPALESGRTSAWTDGDWLVAPLLERRDRPRGVVAVERGTGAEFGPEDREVLTLLAQMAATALGAIELSRAIESNEARLRLLVESAPVGIVETDAAGRIRWWNPPASRILAWPTYREATEVAVHFPDSVAEALAALWGRVALGDVGGVDLDEVPVGNRRRHLTLSAATLPSTDEGTRGFLTLIDDVTDTRQLREEVRHAHTMEVRGQVASRLAHDFNNLLTLISGYAEILSHDLRSDERAFSMVEDIRSTASRASLLTSQLQTIGRTKAPEPVTFNPLTVIASNAEVLERILGSAIDLQWSLDERAGTVRVDADQFEQMVLNLAINARDAMPTGGRLRIGVERTTLDQEKSTALGIPAGVYVLVSVSDNGSGMDEETRRRCFEPLFTTKGPFKGTGMGLAAALRLVVESGGAIDVRSRVGKGTTFSIFLPFVGEPHDEGRQVEVDAPRGSATLLLVDDDEALRRLMGQVLRRNGYRVVEAGSGEEAATIFDGLDHPIDLLVSDVMMDEVTGRELAERLQGREPSLRVLLTSGTADGSVIDGLGPGRVSFLAKPFRPSGLIDAVHELLARA